MTNQEFSDAFDTLLNSFSTKLPDGEQPANIALDEYEKSLFLTLALEEVVINLYNGKNPYGDSFESTEELRRYLDGLVKTKSYKAENKKEILSEEKVHENSIFFELPEKIAFITYELVTFADDLLGCYNGQVADVYPVTLDEYNRISRNPFRGATKYRVLRIDTGSNMVELISKYNIGKYLIKYLAKPSPIILEKLPEGLKIEGEDIILPCILNPILHDTILRRAVQMAIASKSINNRNSKGES